MQADQSVINRAGLSCFAIAIPVVKESDSSYNRIRMTESVFDLVIEPEWTRGAQAGAGADTWRRSGSL